MRIERKKSDKAVSEVIGAILMVGIGVALFSILYFIVMSYPFTPPLPSVDIVGSIEENYIIMEHRGGDSLGQNTIVSFTVGATRISKTVQELLIDLNGNNRWDIGERLVYFNSSMTNLHVEVTVVDTVSNSIVVTAVLQEVAIAIPPLNPSLDTTVNPFIPYNQTSSPLTVYATGDSRLDNITFYYRWSDDNTSWDGGYAIIDDAVDSNLCNVDGLNNIGTETNFANVKDLTPDTDVMNVQEVDVRGQNYNDTIEDNSCDVDGSPDRGTETSFVNAKGINPDASVMTIEEANQGWFAGNENKVVDSWSSTYNSWTETGVIPYLDADDYNTNYITTSSRNINEGWFTFADTIAPAGATIYCNISINAWRSVGSDDYADIYVDYTGGAGSDLGNICTTTDSNGIQTINIGGLTVTQANALRVYFRSIRVGGQMGTLYVDYAYVNFQWSANLDYEADFEYQFTGTNFTQDNEQVCILVTSHTGSETLNVNYRDAGSWTNLGSITTTGWTNLTATGLTAVTYTIQLIDSNETGDSSQDSWSIDLIKLHCWNNSNYQIDFEFNWTGANFISSIENLCMYVISHTGSENLNIYYWTGSAWSSLSTITITGWSNFTATGLTSSTYTMLLKGATESGDIVQDTWNIDVIILRTWNISGGLHGQNWIIWPNILNPDANSPWCWNFNFPKGIGFYEFYSIGRYAGTVEDAPTSADARCRYT